MVDTTDLQPKRHWVMQGVPVSDQFHIVERIRMAKDRQSFTVELIMTDPVNWEGEWRNTKRFKPVKGEDVVESHCLPDLNEHIVATHDEHNQRRPKLAEGLRPDPRTCPRLQLRRWRGDPV